MMMVVVMMMVMMVVVMMISVDVAKDAAAHWKDLSPENFKRLVCQKRVYPLVMKHNGTYTIYRWFFY